MKNQDNTLAPVRSGERIESLDIMRGFVLFGILLMNINGFGLAESYSDPTVSGGSEGLNLYTWITTNLFFEGTMRALFSLLFGVGMFILLQRLTAKGGGIKSADIYFRRLLWLLVFGLIHGYLLLWTGEILYDYALMGFLVFSFRNLSPKKLIMTALIFISIGTVWNYFEYRNNIKLTEQVAQAEAYKAQGKELDRDLKAATARWEEIQDHRSPEYIQMVNENMRKGYFDVVAFLAPFNMRTDTSWFYRWDVWDILSMMLIGIALFKLDILSGKRSYRFYALMAFTGYLIGLSVNYFEISAIIKSNFSFLETSRTSITYDLGRVPVAMGHIALIMIFSKLPILKLFKKSIAAVGKMALTNYIMHSVICMFVFTGVGLGLFGKLQRYELLYVVFGIWILQLILSPIWLKYFYFGPLEWLWRNLTYLKKQEFKIKPVSGFKTATAVITDK